MSVNLSARQFQHPALAPDIAEALRAAGLHPSSLTVEITESVLMQHTPTTVATLERLRRTGIRVAIDDFGTGYSSLSYLQRFPIDVLKVDRSFVQDATLDGEDSVLARAIVEIGSALRLSVIAEGIERREQLAALRAFGCSQGQGYLFAPPLDASDAERLIGAELRPWASLMGDTSPPSLRVRRGRKPAVPSMVSGGRG